MWSCHGVGNAASPQQTINFSHRKGIGQVQTALVSLNLFIIYLLSDLDECQVEFLNCV